MTFIYAIDYDTNIYQHLTVFMVNKLPYYEILVMYRQ